MYCRYVAPEYASTGMLNERSDVYSFGVLIMEIITGRSPVDYSRPPSEVFSLNCIKIRFLAWYRSPRTNYGNIKSPQDASFFGLLSLKLVTLHMGNHCGGRVFWLTVQSQLMLELSCTQQKIQ